MKKIITVILAVCVLLTVAACGNPAPAEPTAEPVQETASPAPEAAETPADEPEAEEPDVDLIAIANEYIDKPVEELYEAIGYPESSDYASSCLGDGEDGNLYYDGFIVYTYREGDEEIVRFVE